MICPPPPSPVFSLSPFLPSSPLFPLLPVWRTLGETDQPRVPETVPFERSRCRDSNTQPFVNLFSISFPLPLLCFYSFSSIHIVLTFLAHFFFLFILSSIPFFSLSSIYPVLTFQAHLLYILFSLYHSTFTIFIILFFSFLSPRCRFFLSPSFLLLQFSLQLVSSCKG